MTVEGEPRREQVDLSPLSQMGEVRDRLRELVEEREIDKEEFRQKLGDGLKKYEKLRFGYKVRDLTQIIDWFDEGRIGMDEILKATFPPEAKKEREGVVEVGILKRIFGRLRRR